MSQNVSSAEVVIGALGVDSLHARYLLLDRHMRFLVNKQEGQVALNRSPEFFKLTYRYLLKADHVPGDTWGGAIFGPRGII